MIVKLGSRNVVLPDLRLSPFTFAHGIFWLRANKKLSLS